MKRDPKFDQLSDKEKLNYLYAWSDRLAEMQAALHLVHERVKRLEEAALKKG